MKRVCFFSVIYPAVLPYLHQFFLSLQNQSYVSFEILLLNDGIPKIELEEFLRPYNKNVFTFDYQGDILSNRLKGIQWMSQRLYDYVIFGDADDLFPQNRIEVAIKKLQNADLVVNDVIPFFDNNELEKNKGFWENRIENHTSISKSFLSKQNIIGFGNCAVRGKVLQLAAEIENKYVMIPDWYVFSTLVYRGVKALFTTDTCIYYRQHESNIVGRKSLTADELLKICKIKMDHYKAISYSSKKNILAVEQQMDLLKEQNFRIEYLKYINEMNFNFFWWEEVNYIKQFLNERYA